MSQPIIDIKDLSFTYGRQPVLSGVNLRLDRGDFVALLGPNGGGKSTLVKLCLGLLKPQSGGISIMGLPVDGRPHPTQARIGYVPQDFEGQAGFPITVLDLVLTGRLKPGRPGWRWGGQDRAAAQKALEEVGMWDRRRGRWNRLSGGQRQRVVIARALASEPELLFLDEPVASVDQEWQTRLYELFKELNRRTTIVMVSHDLTAVSSHVKSVACVNELVHYHPRPEITARMLAETYRCPVELIAHGLPHRVLAGHGSEETDHQGHDHG